jgi:hypothetical protein
MFIAHYTTHATETTYAPRLRRNSFREPKYHIELPWSNVPVQTQHYPFLGEPVLYTRSRTGHILIAHVADPEARADGIRPSMYQ